ncbi:glycosyltransferase [Lithospermum erythrorhizon]|uniref:Hexosyltransferase n=1 Tax=Lithospermum erythrorhizon TaxID=34254 RepID=A0AAV3NGP5_LITER
MSPPEVTTSSSNTLNNNFTSSKHSNNNINENACAYITFLAGDGDYIKGVVGLAKGLRKVKAAYPLVVAVLPDVPEEHRRVLANQGCIVRQIEPVSLPDDVKLKFARPYFGINYSKLRIWELVEYDKMIYLDADIQVFDNIDNLFDMEDGYFYAVVDCLCEMSSKPCPDKIQWPTELGPSPPFYFNAGMFMFQPSLSTYKHLLYTLNFIPSTPFAEQDLLNMFFRDISKPLDPAYNLLLTMRWRHPEIVEVDSVKVVHYCAPGSKPWRFTGEEPNMDREDIKMLVKRWWDIYNDENLDVDTSGASSNHHLSVLVAGGVDVGGDMVMASATNNSVRCVATTANAA